MSGVSSFPVSLFFLCLFPLFVSLCFPSIFRGSSFTPSRELPPSRDDVMCVDFSAYSQSLESSLTAVDANAEAVLRKSREVGEVVLCCCAVLCCVVCVCCVGE